MVQACCLPYDLLYPIYALQVSLHSRYLLCHKIHITSIYETFELLMTRISEHMCACLNLSETGTDRLSTATSGSFTADSLLPYCPLTTICLQ